MIAGGRGVCAALLSVAALAACTEVTTASNVPVSLQFDSLPSLSVVVGDTLRGDSLTPVRLPVRAFDGSGALVSDSLLRVIGIDTTSVAAFRLISNFRLVGVKEAAAVRVVAQAGSLQSQTQTFAVVPRPTRMVRADSTVVDSIFYNRADTTKRSLEVGVVLLRQVPDSAATPINGLRVRFTVDSVPTALLDSVRIEGTSSGKRASSALMSGGSARVKVKVYPKAGASGAGFVVLRATHGALGTATPGSPVTLRVRVVPSPAVSGSVVRSRDPLAPARALP